MDARAAGQRGYADADHVSGRAFFDGVARGWGSAGGVAAVAVEVEAVSSTAPKSISFRAAVLPYASAIMFDGNGDGGQVKLFVPRPDVGALLLLQQYGLERVLIVTIEFGKADTDMETESSGE